jgi:hypothetical protein
MQSCRRQLNLRLSCVIRPSINIAHGNSVRSLLANKTEVFHLTPRFLLASKRLEKRSSCLKKARSCGTLRRSSSERPSRNCVEGRLGTPGRHAGRDARSRPWSRDVSLGSMRARGELEPQPRDQWHGGMAQGAGCSDTCRVFDNKNRSEFVPKG